MEKIQVKAVNMVSGLRGTTYAEKLEELGLATPEERRRRQDLVQTYKFINDDKSGYREGLFKLQGEGQLRRTRAGADP